MKVCSVVCFEDEGQILSSANDIKERNTEDFEDSNILTFYVTEMRYLFKRFKKDFCVLYMYLENANNSLHVRILKQ